jgi:sterol desaturase/sphingolipid hydroxylase (fatty acid hydroxylase superfamily)
VSLDSLFKRLFGDDEPTHLGSGWTAGVVSVLAGLIALGGVLCFHFPDLLSAPRFRGLYPIGLLRAVLGGLLVVAVLAGVASAAMRRRKVLALTGVGLATAAALLGGPSVPLPTAVDGSLGLGLEWFLLNVLVLALVFVPLERLSPLRRAQEVFRAGWTTDGVHFLVSHLFVQILSVASLVPARLAEQLIFGATGPRLLGTLPLAVQLPVVVIAADLFQYWIHRAFHRLPALWRFHAVHHSSPAMDWLAAFRLHLGEALVVRGVVLTPLVLLGVSNSALTVYLVFVSFHALFIHSNFAPSLRWLEVVLVTPRLHHFHHAADHDAIDKNFAVHVPWLDRLFGTFHAPPGRWPATYGVAGETAPDGYLAHLAWPFRRRR